MSQLHRSDFGSGIVVCLAKFSEHMGDHFAEVVVSGRRWMQMSESAQYETIHDAARYPHGDSARFLLLAQSCMVGDKREPERILSSAIEMWANAASDHFYDLDVRAPAPLHELARLTLAMGHGAMGAIWTWEDWLRVRSLWQESCLAVDRMVGVAADWGQS